MTTPDTGQTDETPKPNALPMVGGAHGSNGSARPPQIISAAGLPEADAGLPSLMRQCGIDLRLQIEERFLKGAINAQVTGCSVSLLAGHNLADAKLAAAHEIGKLLMPATRRQIEGWLAELGAITRPQINSDVNASLRLRAYTDRLADYPEDIVREVLLVRTYEFFPTWADLEATCKSLMFPRVFVMRQINGMGEN